MRKKQFLQGVWYVTRSICSGIFLGGSRLASDGTRHQIFGYSIAFVIIQPVFRKDLNRKQEPCTANQ